MMYILGITTLDFCLYPVLNNFKKRKLIMTYGNLIKNKIQHVFGGLFDMLSIGREQTDSQMKCMHFGICGYAPKEVEEVPFFHY